MGGVVAAGYRHAGDEVGAEAGRRALRSSCQPFFLSRQCSIVPGTAILFQATGEKGILQNTSYGFPVQTTGNNGRPEQHRKQGEKHETDVAGTKK